ncbi:MAG: flippase-like domain-containing protein [Sphingobacteriia bacterium]|nr:flippase-like domain-containing protein [Sphingobacteriia bacterium]NCC39646.1 flippase-like domain-containing protein [Gammaproteobacteria bacterium]
MIKTTRWPRLILGLLITLLFIWLVARAVDPASLGAAFAAIPWWAWILGLLLLAAGYGLRILRWWLMLRALATDLPLRATAWPLISSIAVNNVLPLRAGDALRVLGFRQQLRAPAMRVLGTLLIERLLDLLTLLGFFFVGLWLLQPTSLPRTFVVAATWLTGAGVLLLLLLILSAPALLEWLRKPRPDGGWWGRWASRIETHGTHLIESFALLRSPGHALVLVVCSIACWTFEGAIFAVLVTSSVQALHGYAGWLAMSLGTLATLLPSSPGYLGTFDYFTMQGLIASGAPVAQAAAIAIAVHLILWVPLTLLGLGYLAVAGSRLGQRGRAARTSTERF